MIETTKPQRGVKIIDDNTGCNSKTRRGARIMENEMMDNKQQKYHPEGVPFQLHNLCYNHTIPAGIKTKILRMADEIVVTIIETKNND